jgi:hypothetical protein
MKCKLRDSGERIEKHGQQWMVHKCARWRCSQPPMASPHPAEKCHIHNCRSPLAGVGNALAWAIDFATLSQGKKIADLFARKVLRKPGCGCGKRQSAMNDWGERWMATLLGWWRSGTSALNALGRRITG